MPLSMFSYFHSQKECAIGEAKYEVIRKNFPHHMSVYLPQTQTVS